jgi:hypothetical protein
MMRPSRQGRMKVGQYEVLGKGSLERPVPPGTIDGTFTQRGNLFARPWQDGEFVKKNANPALRAGPGVWP